MKPHTEEITTADIQLCLMITYQHFMNLEGFNNGEQTK